MIDELRLFSIEARRLPNAAPAGADLRRDYKSNVPQIEVINSKSAKVSFGFMVHYSNVGIIRMEGTMVYRGDTKELARTWKDSKQMPEDIATEVHTAIMDSCIPEAVMVARDIGLPPPIPMPRTPAMRKPQADEAKDPK